MHKFDSQVRAAALGVLTALTYRENARNAAGSAMHRRRGCVHCAWDPFTEPAGRRRFYGAWNACGACVLSTAVHAASSWFQSRHTSVHSRTSGLPRVRTRAGQPVLYRMKPTRVTSHAASAVHRTGGPRRVRTCRRLRELPSREPAGLRAFGPVGGGFCSG